MKVSVSLSRQQQDVLRAVLAGRSPHEPSLERLIAAAFDEYCREHPTAPGDRQRAG
jgi:hypothetical protein